MDWRSQFDERELQEIEFCETYKNQFSHGTDGHLVRTVVAKMASILDDNQSPKLRKPDKVIGVEIEQVVDTFTCKNRKCVVIKMQFPGTIGVYHNGYVEINQGSKFDNTCIEICGEEITFRGELDVLSDGKYYIGFDTCHYYNDQHPETKTAEHVKARCQEIARQLDERGN